MRMHFIDGVYAPTTMFGYHAVEDKGRRQAPLTTVKHERKILTNTKAKKLLATAQDQLRNHSLVAWMVRKHLDYVSKFHVGFRSGRPSVDSIVQRIFKWHGSPENLDIAKRLGRDEMFRLFELEKVIAGDAALVKLPRLKLQGVESDLIAKGSWGDRAVGGNDWKVWNELPERGIGVNESTGERINFAICNRGNGSQVIFDHLEKAENIIFDGYWTRFTSQDRGVSPLSTAINTVQDLNEAFEFNLIKAKMHALFGIAVMRNPAGTTDLGGAAGVTDETEEEEENDSDTHLDIIPDQINFLDMNPGEDVKIIESGTPSSEFVEASYLYVHLAMMSLDIPITCFDSRRSSFSARIADLNEYEVSCESKRTKNRYVRQAYSNWLLEQIWNTENSAWRLKEIASAVKMTLRDVQEAVEWIPNGSPWLDKYKQAQGEQLAISIGLDNAVDAARRRGGDVFQNIDKQAEVLNYAKSKGVPIAMITSGVRTAEETPDRGTSPGDSNAVAEPEQQ